MKLNQNELIVLRTFALNALNNGGDFALLDEVQSSTRGQFTKRQVAGYAADLQEKGLLTLWEPERVNGFGPKIQQVQLTEKGVKELGRKFLSEFVGETFSGEWTVEDARDNCYPCGDPVPKKDLTEVDVTGITDKKLACESCAAIKCEQCAGHPGPGDFVESTVTKRQVCRLCIAEEYAMWTDLGIGIREVEGRRQIVPAGYGDGRVKELGRPQWVKGEGWVNVEVKR